MFRAISIIILLSMLTMSTGRTLLLLDYFLNRDEVTARYCENKSRPTMKCNGRCHLNKQLLASEKRESPVSGQQKAEQETQSMPPLHSYFLIEPGSLLGLIVFEKQKESFKSHTNFVFRPPCA